MARARPSALGNRPPTRALHTMYAAHSVADNKAKPTPAGLRRSNPPLPSRNTPTNASSAHSQLTARRAVTTDSRSGPSTSKVTAGPNGIRSMAR